MLTSRSIDRMEMELITRGEAFFHVGAAGHEGVAVLAQHLKASDWLHLHYRDKALMLARGLPIGQFFESLLCTKNSHSAGRQMSAHISAPELKILSLVGPVGNNALQAVGVAAQLQSEARSQGAESDAIVLCSVGDGTSQQGEFLEAIAEAVRRKLRVLFWVEDNGYSISTQTAGQTFFRQPGGCAKEFYGVPLHYLPGANVLECDRLLTPLLADLRQHEGPAIVIFQVERLSHHTNADDERVYRDELERQRVQRTADPVRILSEHLRDQGVSSAALEALQVEVDLAVREAANAALLTPEPTANLDARPPLPSHLHQRAEFRGTDSCTSAPQKTGLTMLEGIRAVLRQRLQADSRISLYGEDIEDPKGDVFGITRGLSTESPAQVQNSALTESTIVGVSIGRALAGGRPIACIQFADFLPLAFNQIASELGSIYWRTNGAWRCPVIIMVPCGGYRPGLGPFHAQSYESIIAHVPGVDVYMPSTAGDAAGLLQAAFESERPTVFFYPKALLNDRALCTSGDITQYFVSPGKARYRRSGDALTIVSWGAPIELCLRAADALAAEDLDCDVIDLRSLSPWDREAVYASVRRTRRLVVVHEDNSSCGLGAEIIASVGENVRGPLTLRRVTRPDTYIPCNYRNQLEVLPSFSRILECCAELLDLEVHWQQVPECVDGIVVLEAMGISPADQQVRVLEWHVKDAQKVAAGDLVAEVEADKASFDLRSPVSGVIGELIAPGCSVKVGAALARIRVEQNGARSRRLPREPIALLTKGSIPEARLLANSSEIDVGASDEARVRQAPQTLAQAGLGSIHYVTGSEVISNNKLLETFPSETTQRVLQSTGIERRYHCAAGEDALTLARAATLAALRAEKLTLADLDAIYVSTSTPISISPSMACLLHHQLSEMPEFAGTAKTSRDIVALDLSAACSGWLYALQVAFDYVQQVPQARVLVVTTEHMSRFLDPSDFETAFIFGDAATAVVVHGPTAMAECPLLLQRPCLSAQGEDGSVLSIGRTDNAGSDRRGYGPVAMQGKKVFPLAVRNMSRMLDRACSNASMKSTDLDWVVPHQANGRIISAMQRHTGVTAERIMSNIESFGNTSSSSIPLALAQLLAQGKEGKIGLCAFGGGFTFAAALVETRGRRGQLISA